MCEKKHKTFRNDEFEKQLYGLSDSTYTDDISIGSTRNHIFTKPDVRKKKLRPSMIARHFHVDNLFTSTPMHCIKDSSLEFSPIEKDNVPDAPNSRAVDPIQPNVVDKHTSRKATNNDSTLVNQEHNAEKLRASAAERLCGKENLADSREHCKTCGNATNHEANANDASGIHKNGVLRKRTISRLSKRTRSKRHSMAMQSRLFSYLKVLADQLYTESSEMDDRTELCAKRKQGARHLHISPECKESTSSFKSSANDSSGAKSFIYDATMDIPPVDNNCNCSERPTAFESNRNGLLVQDRHKSHKTTMQDDLVVVKQVNSTKNDGNRYVGCKDVGRKGSNVTANKLDLVNNYRNHQTEATTTLTNCNAVKQNIDVGLPHCEQSISKTRKKFRQDATPLQAQQNTSSRRIPRLSIDDLLEDVNDQSHNKIQDKTKPKSVNENVEAALLEDSQTDPKTKLQRSFASDGMDMESENNSNQDEYNSHRKEKQTPNYISTERAKSQLQCSLRRPSKQVENFDHSQDRHRETNVRESVVKSNAVAPKRIKVTEDDFRNKSGGKDLAEHPQLSKEKGKNLDLIRKSTSLSIANVTEGNVDACLSEGRRSRSKRRKALCGNDNNDSRLIQTNDVVSEQPKNNDKDMSSYKRLQNTCRTKNQLSFGELQVRNFAESSCDASNKIQDCHHNDVNAENCDMIPDNQRRTKTQKLCVSHPQVQKALFTGDIAKRTKEKKSHEDFQMENLKSNGLPRVSGITMHSTFGDTQGDSSVLHQNESALQQRFCDSDIQQCELSKIHQKLFVDMRDAALSRSQLKRYLNSDERVEQCQRSFFDTLCMTPTEQLGSVQKHSTRHTPKQTNDSRTSGVKSGTSLDQNCPILQDDEMQQINGKKDKRKKRSNKQQKVVNEDIANAPSNQVVSNVEMGNAETATSEMKSQRDDHVFKKPLPVKRLKNGGSCLMESSILLNGLRRSTRTRKPNHLQEPLPYLFIVQETKGKSGKTKRTAKKSESSDKIVSKVEKTKISKGEKKGNQSRGSTPWSDECSNEATTLPPNSLEDTRSEGKKTMPTLSVEPPTPESSIDMSSNINNSKPRTNKSNYSTFIMNDQVCKVCWVNDVDEFREDPQNPSMLVSTGVEVVSAGVYSGSLILKPNGQKLPQTSLKYSTSFFVHKGQAEVKVNDCCRSLKAGHSFCVPIGVVYSIQNPSPETDLYLFYSKSRQLSAAKT